LFTSLSQLVSRLMLLGLDIRPLVALFGRNLGLGMPPRHSSGISWSATILRSEAMSGNISHSIVHLASKSGTMSHVSEIAGE